MEYVVSPEAAEEEVQRFLDEMGIDSDVDSMDEDDRKGFESQCRKIHAAIVKGTGVVNENGEFVYTPSRSFGEDAKPITFHERTGASLMAMDTVSGKGKEVTKMYRVLADMCKVPAKTFAAMKGVDIKTCEAAFVLLMA